MFTCCLPDLSKQVVEASVDFVPLMLLTADRPPELLDAGANQAINQVDHFGNFVRFFFNLPSPTDQLHARMVLTTIDTACYRATQVPYGPVHINCQFREPLENPNKWSLTCLSGLDSWMSKAEPFTKYIKFNNLTARYGNDNDVEDVINVIQSANKGLLVIGAIHTEDEIWAALLLAKHLHWPVVCDILSGLRLRRILSSDVNTEEKLIFIDHFDHSLLSDSVKNWAKPNMVVQIGSKFTSKRLGQFFEFCFPHPYILIDKHPCRHDPSHIVTHRIQSTITEFADVLLKTEVPRNPSKWIIFLKAVNMMVAREISFIICSEPLLTEPYVAHIINESLEENDALFLGNSMVIRDIDMYGKGWVKNAKSSDTSTKNNLQFRGIQVIGNRGASGIDGLLSTAIGFAVGSDKKVFCVVGDVSFLHDTNGLAILNQRTRRKAMTILVVNNHGGAIFGLLPVATRTNEAIMNQYFYTSHDVTIGELCSAHSVKHLLIKTKSELQQALWNSKNCEDDCVIEVESCIEENTRFHRTISKVASLAADQMIFFLQSFGISEYVDKDFLLCKIKETSYSLYRIQLHAPLSSSNVETETNKYYREGLILSIILDDGTVGFGEVAPIELHKEKLKDAEEQLRFLLHVIEGCEIGDLLLSLIEGSFSNWIWKSLGIPLHTIFPSVRCGLEMALINVLAAKCSSNFSDVLAYCLRNSMSYYDDRTKRKDTGIPICALVDCDGSPKEVSHIVSRLVDEGFTTIKVKVARCKNPWKDASVIHEIRQTVGCKINIRVDANRKWTYEQAVQFGLSIKHCNLQYIEEPVSLEEDINKFCEETGLPVALDETIDNLKGDVLSHLNKYAHPGIVAVVIKPSVVGGFENASTIAEWAYMHGKMVVISSTFESSLGIAFYAQFARYLEKQNEMISKLHNREFIANTAHGLGTYKWLKEDVSSNSLKICVPPHGHTVEASIQDTDIFMRNFHVNQMIIQRIYMGEQVRAYHLKVNHNGSSILFKLLETGIENNNKVVVFLHGFLGTSEDWIPVMKAISNTARCISVDLPGHGHSFSDQHLCKNASKGIDVSVELAATFLMKLICNITTKEVILVGYSMGARIALNMALKCSEKVDGAIIISGSPGLESKSIRRKRAAQDDALAQYLISHGLECFLETWYSSKLWESLRNHPHFKQIIGKRAKHRDIQALAKSLSDLSVGRQLPLWKDLKQCKTPFLFIAGEMDPKFVDISKKMYSYCGNSPNHRDNTCEMMIMKDCGHAVHLENPLPLITTVRKFITELKK